MKNGVGNRTGFSNIVRFTIDLQLPTSRFELDGECYGEVPGECYTSLFILIRQQERRSRWWLEINRDFVSPCFTISRDCMYPVILTSVLRSRTKKTQIANMNYLRLYRDTCLTRLAEFEAGQHLSQLMRLHRQTVFYATKSTEHNTFPQLRGAILDVSLTLDPYSYDNVQ